MELARLRERLHEAGLGGDRERERELTRHVSQELRAALPVAVRGDTGRVGAGDERELLGAERRRFDRLRLARAQPLREARVELHSEQRALDAAVIHQARAAPSARARRSKVGTTSAAVFRSHSNTSARRRVARGRTCARISQVSASGVGP